MEDGPSRPRQSAAIHCARAIALGVVCLALLLGAVATGMRWQPVAAQGAGSIRGTVVDSNQTPIPDLDALLFRDNGDGSWNNGDFVDTLKTNSLGDFRFDLLSQGTYRLSIQDSRGNYLPAYYFAKETLTDAVDLPLASGQSLVLTDTIVVAPASFIMGTVKNSLGAPLENIRVSYEISRSTADSTAWEPGNFTKTSLSGAYKLVGLWPGQYRVHFEDASTANRVVPEFFDNAFSAEDAKVINLGAQETIPNIDAVLTFYAKITGTVTLSGGAQLPGVYVCVQPSPSALSIPCLNPMTTGPDGSYTVGGLVPGAYMVHFYDPLHPSDNFDVWFNQRWEHEFADVIPLADGEVRPNVNAVLMPASSISGHASAGGLPLEGIEVRLYRDSGSGVEWFHTAHTDAAGEYEFQTVISDTYRVGFFDPSGAYAPNYHSGPQTLGGATAFSLTTPTEPYSKALNIDGVLGDTARSLHGRVVTTGIAPLSGIEVYLYARHSEWIGRYTTAGDGVFVFSGLSQFDDYEVWARDPAGAHGSAYAGGGATLADAAEFFATSPAPALVPDVILGPFQSVGSTSVVTPTGTVFKSATGPTIAGATVTLFRLPGWRARAVPWDAESMTCQSANSVETGGWKQAAPTELGAFENPTAGAIFPAANPILTDATGSFGWVLPDGCWYVTIAAAGYQTAASPLAGAPPRLADLIVVLTPLPQTPTNTPKPPTATPRPSTPTNTPNPPTATPKPVPSATSTRTPTPTPIPASSATPLGVPTATRTPTPTSTSPSALTASVEGRLFADSNGNGLLDEGELPLVGARVRLDGPQAAAAVAAVVDPTAGATLRETLSGGSGDFRFTQVPFGAYILTITPPPSFTPSTPIVRALSVNGDTPAAPLRIALVVHSIPPNGTEFRVLLPTIQR